MNQSTVSPTHKLGGVVPVFQTPFHDDETLDFETLSREIDWLFENGADGIVMAMVSETLRLSSEERDELASTACRLARGRGPVVISVGAESTLVALRHARHARDCGAAALMAIPPVSTALGDDALLEYYERLIAATPLPFIVQDASGYVGRPMSLTMQAELLTRHGPERVLFKPEAVPIGPRLSALREANGGRARVFEGSGGITLVDSFRRGVVGTMPAAELVDVFARLWRALVEQDNATIYRLSPLVASLVALQSGLDGFLAVEKYLLVKRGVFPNSVVRSPRGYTLDEETRQEVDRLYELLMAEMGK